MKFNFKTIAKFLIPIIGLAALGNYYRYKYVLNPDGLRNSKGELYADKFGTSLSNTKFVDKCLTFEQDSSAISYGEIYEPPNIPGVDNSFFKTQRVTLRGYGSLINSCGHDVVVERISMKSRIGDSGEFGGIGEDNYYPNEGWVDEEYKDVSPTNYIFYPDGNILKANSSLKIELATTDSYYEKPLDSYFRSTIPEKNTPIGFKLVKSSERMNFWNYSFRINTDNYDKKKLAEDGLGDFSFSFKNPHGKRSITFMPNGCIVFINGKIEDDDCTMEKWQLIKDGNLIRNSRDFGKYIVK